MEDGDSIGEMEGLGFNLCVVPFPKNKGVLNLDKQRRQVGCIFAKVNNNYKLEKYIQIRKSFILQGSE